jgi:hypothetical protein
MWRIVTCLRLFAVILNLNVNNKTKKSFLDRLFFGGRQNRMHKLKYLSIFIILFISLSFAGPSYSASASRLEGISPSLGAAASYSVLAGSIVTNTGDTTMPGNLGISPSIGVPPHYTGFPPGFVGPPGVIHDADADAAAAQADATAAFTFLDQSCDTTYPGVQDLTLVSPLGPGIYCADAFILSGNLTLSGSGVWIFKSASTLTTSSNSSVTGGDPCNVWWRLVSSGTIGTGTTFIGNILALTDIALQTGATLDGRALAQTGQVTLDSNIITGPICSTQPTATTTTGAPTATTGAPTATTAAPTATNLPAVTALPGTGGAPIRNDVSPWGLVIAGGFSALALILGFRAYRKTSRPRQ